MQRRDPEEPSYTVSDRRWWTREEDEGQQGPAEVERKPNYVENLEAKLRDRDTKLREALEHLHRVSSEFEQAKARLQRESAKEIERGRRDFLRSFLEVLDDLDRALATARERGADPALRQGIELVQQRFLSLLQQQGVRRIDPEGQPFDPAHHEAVSILPAHDPAHDGLVLNSVKPGYLVGEETLRPAQVVVGRRRTS